MSSTMQISRAAPPLIPCARLQRLISRTAEAFNEHSSCARQGRRFPDNIPAPFRFQNTRNRAMAEQTTLLLNGAEVAVSSSPDAPLLYVLSDELQLQGPRFGCGLAQCGSCSVLVDGIETRSCVTPLSTVAGKRI